MLDLVQLVENARSEQDIISNIEIFENFYQEVNELLIISNNRDLVDNIPHPVTYRLDEFVFPNGEKHNLENTLNKPTYPNRIFFAYRWNRFPGIFTEEDSKTFKLVEILNNIVFTRYERDKGNLRKIELKKRDYEEVLRFTHPLKVEFLLPKNAPRWVHVLALSHDVVEDSQRHRYLEDWYKGKLTEEGKETLESMLGENFFREQGIKCLPVKFKETIYAGALDTIHNQYLSMVRRHGSLNDEEIEKLSKGLKLLTEPVTLDYKDYLKRIAAYSKENSEVAYWAMNIKLNDRIDNSHFNADWTNEEEFTTNVKKVIKDGLKNIYLLQVAKQMYLYLKEEDQISGEEEHQFLMRLDSLASLTNRNMNYLINKINDTYSELEVPIGALSGTPLSGLFSKLQKGLKEYYIHDPKKGEISGFDRKDEKRASYQRLKDITKFEGWLTLLDDWLERREFKHKQLIDPFGNNLAGYLQKTNALKSALVLKVLACLHLSHEPYASTTNQLRFDANGKDPFDLLTQGSYDKGLTNYLTQGFLKI